MAENQQGSNADVAKDRILTMPLENIKKSFLEDLFGAHHNKNTNQFEKSQFEPTDAITLTPDEYPFVKQNTPTTLGRLFMNRYVLENSGIIAFIGYWNTPLNKKGVRKLDAAAVDLLIQDKIDIDQYATYIDNRDRLGFWSASFLSVSITSALLLPMKDVEKRKHELFKENRADLNSDSPVTQIMTTNRIQDELMGMVKKNLENDIGYDMYASGDGNLNNNYKTINVMRGAVFNDATGKYDVVEASLMNGIDKKDIAPFSNSNLAAAYPSAIGTAQAGYMGKIFMAVAQEQTIDPNPKSDCGTKMTIPVTITESNKRFFLFRNFDINGKIVMSTAENIDKFTGKTLHMYSPQCCLHDKICAKCAGQIFYKMGVTNVGLLTTDATDALLNLKLKAKHDLSQKAGGIPKNYIFGKQNNYADVTPDGYLVNKVTMKAFIPRMFEDFSGFVIEYTTAKCMGIFPVAFYDNKDKEIFRTTMIIPCVMTFNVYGDVQETKDHYIITYEPNSKICSLNIAQSYVNAEYFINQVYLYSSTPQLPYHLMTEFMWRCLELNGVNLQGISLTYELLARSLCRSGNGNKSFAQEYGKGGVDPMSYTKYRYRDSVQRSGVLQGMLFEDVSKSLLIGLSQTLNGVEPKDTPLEKVIRA